MIEKRRFLRFNLRLPIKVRLFDKESKTFITNEIDAHTQNVSRGGMRLALPKGWDCPECTKCLGWAYNLGCKLKNNHTENNNRFVPDTLAVKLSILDSSLSEKGAINLDGDLVWVKTDVEVQEREYPVGVSFSEASQQRISLYLSSRNNP